MMIDSVKCLRGIKETGSEKSSDLLNIVNSIKSVVKRILSHLYDQVMYDGVNRCDACGIDNKVFNVAHHPCNSRFDGTVTSVTVQ